MATTTSKTRVAQLQVQTVAKGRSTITAFVPTKVRGAELEALNKVLVDKVIKDLTGCPCLSGVVDVIFKDDLVDSIRVDLASGKIG
jgi:hypothetical protein